MSATKKYMFRNWKNHIDSATVVLNLTTLAEDAAIAIFDRPAIEREFEEAYEVLMSLYGEDGVYQ